MDYASMGSRIRQMRKRKKMTQAEMANVCGISTSFMGHIERGSRIASIDTLMKISDELEATVDYLLTGDVHVGAMLPEGQTYKVRMLSDIVRVLDTYSDAWLRHG